GELAKALLDARAGREQGRAEQEAKRRPTGRGHILRPRGIRLRFAPALHYISWLDRPRSARTAPVPKIGGRIQAYCRRIVNRNKRIMAPPMAGSDGFLIASHHVRRPGSGGLAMVAQGPSPL